MYTCRSKDFRCTYGKIHEIRALVPQGIPFMACTATVTKSVRDEMITLLDMKGCEVVPHPTGPTSTMELNLILR